MRDIELQTMAKTDIFQVIIKFDMKKVEAIGFSPCAGDCIENCLMTRLGVVHNSIVATLVVQS